MWCLLQSTPCVTVYYVCPYLAYVHMSHMSISCLCSHFIYVHILHYVHISSMLTTCICLHVPFKIVYAHILMLITAQAANYLTNCQSWPTDAPHGTVPSCQVLIFSLESLSTSFPENCVLSQVIYKHTRTHSATCHLYRNSILNDGMNVAARQP